MKTKIEFGSRRHSFTEQHSCNTYSGHLFRASYLLKMYRRHACVFCSHSDNIKKLYKSSTRWHSKTTNGRAMTNDELGQGFPYMARSPVYQWILAESLTLKGALSNILVGSFQKLYCPYTNVAFFVTTCHPHHIVRIHCDWENGTFHT